MDYTILLQGTENAVRPLQKGQSEIHSLYRALQELADPRKKKGKRYELALVLTLLVLAKLAGETTLSAAPHWIRLRGKWLAEQLRLKRTAMPCQNTYRSVLAQLDAKAGK